MTFGWRASVQIPSFTLVEVSRILKRWCRSTPWTTYSKCFVGCSYAFLSRTLMATSPENRPKGSVVFDLG